MAGGGIPQILWGTNFENVLQFGYPIDSPVTGRKPRDGSEWGQSASGVEDAWITGYDYELSADFRWIPDDQQTDPVASPWGGPVGVQAFLDWARQKNTFRYVPDMTVPDFYVDGCYLAEPLDSHGSLESDATRNLHLLIRNPSVDFALALRGIMFEYAPGRNLTDPVAATFTRASTATRIARLLGLEPLATEAINVLRDRHYEGALRTTLLEGGSRQNLIENGDYEADTVGTTAVISTIVRDATNVRLGAWALKVTTTNATSSGANWAKRDGTKILATAALAYSGGAWIYAPAASIGKTLRFLMDWYTAADVFISTSNPGSVTLVAGWQRIVFNNQIAPGTTGKVVPGLYTDAAEGVFDFWVDVAQFEAGAFASSAIPTVTAAVTRSPDVFSWPYPYSPQALFVLVDFIERGSYLFASSNPGYASVGEAANASFFLMPGGVTSYTFMHRRASDVSSSITLTPALGDRIQLLGLLSGTGTAQIKGSKNAAAEVVGNVSVASALAAAWATQILLVGRRFTGDAEGFAAFVRVKIGPLTFGGVTRDTLAKALLA